MGCRCAERAALILKASRDLRQGQLQSAARTGRLIVSSVKTDAARAARLAMERARLTKKR